MVNKRDLKSELRQAGADGDELDALMSVADRLSRSASMPVHQLPPDLLQAKRTFSSSILRRNLLTAAKSLAVVAMVFTIGGAAVALAQNSLPGDRLYGVKLLSEQAAVKFNPKFRDQLMMRRAQEVRDLVVKHRDDRLVLDDLQAYGKAVAANRAGSYPAFDYCASMLKSAEPLADEPVRQAIAQSLLQLPDNG